MSGNFRKSLQILTIGCYCVLASLVPQVAGAESETPQQAIEGFFKTLRSMEFPVKDDTRHEGLVAQADAYLDLESMGEKALAKHWGEATPEEQKNFFELMWKLI